MRLFTTLHNYKKNYLAKDLIAGVVMAAVSIPIAMGYAEVSGLPAHCPDPDHRISKL